MYLFPSHKRSSARRSTGSCFSTTSFTTVKTPSALSVAPTPSATSIAIDVIYSLDSSADAFYSESHIIQWIAEGRPFRVIEGALSAFHQQYRLGKMIGAGAYGKVMLCQRKRDGAEFAVKCIPKRGLAACQSTEILLRHIRALRNEVSVLRMASSHPNVASLYDVYEDNEHVFLVLEHCAGGELFEQLVADGSLDEAKAAAITKQLCDVLKFLHEKCGVVHCDLKPANILLADTHSLKIKLVDFGMAQILGPDEFQSIPCGSPKYTAPEVIETRVRKSHYSHPCDMWSLGVILFVMLFKFPPFFVTATESKGKSAYGLRKAIYRKVMKGFTPKLLSVDDFGYGPWFPDSITSTAAARDIMSRLLCLDATKRMTAAQALDHPWLSGRTDDAEVGTASDRWLVGDSLSVDLESS